MCSHDTYQSNSAKPEIIHNRGRCKLCGDIIESTDRHEFVTCRCGACSVVTEDMIISGGVLPHRITLRNCRL